jgi:hypothetical protein
MYQEIQLGDYLNMPIYHGALQVGNHRGFWYYALEAGYQSGRLNGHYHHDNGESNELVSLELNNNNPFYFSIQNGITWGALQVHLGMKGYRPWTGIVSLGIEF